MFRELRQEALRLDGLGLEQSLAQAGTRPTQSRASGEVLE
jgi:hypothetical protein